MTVVLFLIPAIVAALLSYWLVRPVTAIAFRVGAIDTPGPRKIHSAPMPRLGGLAVVTAAFLVFAALSLIHTPRVYFLSSHLLAGIAGGLAPIFIISLADDIRSVRALTKLAVHVLGAGIAVALGNHLPDAMDVFGQHIRLGWLAFPLSVMWIVGVTNAFNVIDGLDGLSTGLALISSASLAAVALIVGHYEMASASLILAGALLGFLPHNIYPARIFLGDTGATAIGFVLACLTLSGGSTTSAGLAVALPLLIVGVPLADTVIAVIRRLVRRFEGYSGGVFEADGRHIHHRLLALGLNQWRATLTLYAAGMILALIALASLFVEQRRAALLLIAIAVAALVGISKLDYDEFALTRRGALLRLYDGPVLRLSIFAAFIDIVLVVVALYVSVVLKYDDWNLSEQRFVTTQLIALLSALTIGVFVLMRVYRCSWRYANVEDMLKISAATFTAGFAGYMVSALSVTSTLTPTFFSLYTICLFSLVAASRVSYRVLNHLHRRANQHGEPVVIYGAGNGGSLALREIQANFDVPMSPVGFIDDDPSKRGLFVNGFPVFGTVDDLGQLVTSRHIRGVVVASENIDASKLNKARLVCRSAGLWIRRFGVSFREFISDRRRVDRRQKVAAVSFPDRRHLMRRRKASPEQDVVLEENRFIAYARDWSEDPTGRVIGVVTGIEQGRVTEINAVAERDAREQPAVPDAGAIAATRGRSDREQTADAGSDEVVIENSSAQN